MFTILLLLKQTIKEFIFKMKSMENEEHKLRGYLCLQKLLNDYSFQTVLDIGSGEGIHAQEFAANGKSVTTIDYGESVYYKKAESEKGIISIIADFNTYEFDTQYDCVWCCHCLEHQLNIQETLEKIQECLIEGGILAITVPVAKTVIVGGHVNLFNAGLLLYRLILAGFDCSEASVKTYGNNISILVRKKSISVMNEISFDMGDIKILKQYFPAQCEFYESSYDAPFWGDIRSINW